jgi:hypothetical protein
MTADPFLAFIRELLWEGKQPTLLQGMFAAHWTLHHAIRTSPGGVAGPIHLAVLEKNGKARELGDAELQEQVRAIGAVEESMRGAARNALAPEQLPGPAQQPPP